jgi:predicted DCC family thiol-disulfide oxidoreductase YuxK
MIKLIKSLLKKSFEKKIDSRGLAAFRILFAIVLLLEIIDLYTYRHLIFDAIPYIEKSEINHSLPLLLWILNIFFIIIGFKTKINVVINYIFLTAYLGSIRSYEYHMFYSYMGIGFLWIFMPIEKSWSVDRLISRLKFSNSKINYQPEQKVSQLYYYLPVYIGIGLVYLDSLFYKTISPFWMEGLGMWRPAVMPQFNHYGDHFTLNSEWITRSLGLITLIFETIFIFLFWYKPFRIPFLIIGLGLHLGILLFFPIPLFAIGVIAIYLLLVPVSFWKKISFKFKKNKPSLYFLYDKDCPLCNRTKIFIETLDIFNKIEFIEAQNAKNKLINQVELTKIDDHQLLIEIYSLTPNGKIYKGINTYIQVLFRMIYTAPFAIILMIPGINYLAKKIYSRVAENRTRIPCNDDNCSLEIIQFPEQNENQKIFVNFTKSDLRRWTLGTLFIGLTLIQISVSFNSGLIIKIRENISMKDTKVDRILSSISSNTEWISKRMFGITHHPVFMDGHMTGYNLIFSIVRIKNGKEEWLPIIDKNGQPGKLIYGPRWVNWTFRVIAPNINKEKIESGIIEYTAFWLGYNKIGFENEKFIIKARKIIAPNFYTSNLLNRQTEKQWIDVGEILWINEKYTIELNYKLIKK